MEIIAPVKKKTAELYMDNSNIKILLVDDREDNLFSLEAILQQDGYQLHKATSGRNALKILLKEQDFSLILMDVQMPDLNGFETASMIYDRDKLKNIPIIFITAFEYGDENVYQGYQMGAVDYIYKPINKDLLRAKIAVFIDLYKKNNQLKEQEQKLIRINSELEQRVRDRTDELLNKNVELELKNKELQRINSDLDNFIYSASHDLKAPIANLEGLTSILRKRMTLKLADEEIKIFDLIKLSINKFNLTIKDLTEIAKVQKDAGDQKECVSFKEIFDDIRIDTQKLVKECSASINEFYDVPELWFARKNMRSICYNLFTNAIKYRDPKKDLIINIQTYRKGEYVVLSVADNGLGIDPIHKEKMFIMFRRFHNHVEGSGIGLYIVKKIVENHGGKIELESEKGKGATFKIYFKLTEKET
jgi:two-component system, sensor histidine kinase and response regulator